MIIVTLEVALDRESRHNRQPRFNDFRGVCFLMVAYSNLVALAMLASNDDDSGAVQFDGGLVLFAGWARPAQANPFLAVAPRVCTTKSYINSLARHSSVPVFTLLSLRSGHSF